MLTSLHHRLIASTTALALGTALIVAPTAGAEEKTTDVKLPMACGVRLDPSKVTGPIAFIVKPQIIKAEGVHKSQDFKLAFPVTAPETVESGAQFNYTILPTTFSLPNKLSQATLKEASQVNLWFDLPSKDIATLNQDGISLKGDDTGKFKVEITNDNRLHIWTPETNKPADVTKWNADNKTAWHRGGLEVPKVDGKFQLVTPTVTLQMTATGKAGEVIKPVVRDTDPAQFPRESFVQAYAVADAIGYTIPAFVRCGLDKASGNFTDFPAVKITAKKFDTKAILNLQDSEGDAVAQGTELLVTDGADTTTVTAGEGGVVTLTYPLAAGEKKTVLVAFKDNPDATQEVTLTGAEKESSTEFTVKQQTEVVKFDNPVQVKLVASEGNAMPEGTKVKVFDAPLEAEYAAGADGIVKFNVRLKANEKKTVTVSFADDPETTVNVDLVGGENKEAVEATLTHKPVEIEKPQDNDSDNTDEQPEAEGSSTEGSSLGSLEVPKVLGIIVSALVGMQALAFILRSLTDFARSLRLF